MRAPRYGEAALKRHLERLDAVVQLESMRATRRAWLAKQRSVYEGVPSLTQARSRESIALTNGPVLAARAAACFGGENLALAVSGDVDGRALREALQPLAELPRGRAMVHPPSQVKPRKRFVALVPSSSEQVRVTLSGPGLPPGGHRFAAYVLIGILRSEIEAELRRFGEVYSVRTAIDVGPGDGATWLSFGTRREVAFEATQRAIQIIEWWWRQWPVTANAMNRLRDQIRGHPPAGREAAELHARAALQDLALHDGRPWEEQLATVAMEDVRAFFERSFRPDQLQVLVTGPLDESAPWVELNVP
jgi:predicted Zn-dependent peptidase